MTLEGEQESVTKKSPLINVAELAERWGISEKEAIEMVRHRGVPFLRMSHAIGRVKWHKVRFSLAAIEHWEATSQEKFRGGPPTPVPPSPAPRSARGKEAVPQKTLLGKWRESSPVS